MTCMQGVSQKHVITIIIIILKASIQLLLIFPGLDCVLWKTG
jgi:hypothetical protein